jgi:hypothetical protein
MGKKALVNNEAKIAGMIDNAVSDNQEPELQKEKSKVVHVHVKRTASAGIRSTGDFGILSGSHLAFKLETTRLIFAFNMISFKLRNKGKIATKFSLNGREIAETRQTLSMVQEGAITSAFAEVVNPSGKDIELNVLVDANTDGEINSSKYDHNLSYGAISMPVGAVFKHINARTLTFKKSDNWIGLNSFDMTVNYQGKNEAYFMVLYNIGIKLGSATTLHTRLNIDGKPVKVIMI